MTTQYLHDDIHRHKHIKISADLVEMINGFQKMYVVNSMESSLLVLAGHRPIEKWKFDTGLLTDWCIENGFEWMKDEYKREYQFRFLKL